MPKIQWTVVVRSLLASSIRSKLNNILSFASPPLLLSCIFFLFNFIFIFFFFFLILWRYTNFITSCLADYYGPDYWTLSLYVSLLFFIVPSPSSLLIRHSRVPCSTDADCLTYCDVFSGFCSINWVNPDHDMIDVYLPLPLPSLPLSLIISPSSSLSISPINFCIIF